MSDGRVPEVVYLGDRGMFSIYKVKNEILLNLFSGEDYGRITSLHNTDKDKVPSSTRLYLFSALTARQLNKD
jgi:hypothetical protein